MHVKTADDKKIRVSIRCLDSRGSFQKSAPSKTILIYDATIENVYSVVLNALLQADGSHIDKGKAIRDKLTAGRANIYHNMLKELVEWFNSRSPVFQQRCPLDKWNKARAIIGDSEHIQHRDKTGKPVR